MDGRRTSPYAGQNTSQTGKLYLDSCQIQNHPTVHKILQLLLTKPEDQWVQNWMRIQQDVGITKAYSTRKELNDPLRDWSVSHVMAIKSEHTTMAVVPQPKSWFKLQTHVTNSFASQTLCCVRAGNTLLGNRFKNRYGRRYNMCPHCRLVRNKQAVHLFNCPIVSRQSQYKLRALRRGPCTAQAILRSYLGGDGAEQMQLLECGRRMAIILEAWLVKIHE